MTEQTAPSSNDPITQARIEASAEVPMIIITRDFRATPEQVIRAHTDPDLYARWIGPSRMGTRIDQWDARSGGSWAFTQTVDGEEYSFHGCFHEIGADRIVQTFTFDLQPHDVSLETLTVTDLGNGWTRLRGQSLVDSFEGRDAWLASGMETGVTEGYAKLDALLAE